MAATTHTSFELNNLIPPAPLVNTWSRFIHQFEPHEFTNWIDESESWKTTAYIGDWSALSNKLVVKGPDAIRFFQDISVNSFKNFQVGRAKHSVQCSAEGRVIAEGVLMRLSEDEVKFTGGPIFWAEYQFEKGNYDATLTQRGTADFIIQIQGPKSLEILERASGESHRDYAFMNVRETTVAGHKVWSLRQGMSGELGFELHGDGAHALEVHEALLAAGEEFGVRRLGARTKMVNHVEACFPTPLVDYMPAMGDDMEFVQFMMERHPELAYLAQFSSTGSHVPADPTGLYRTPVELGWGKVISFDHDFIGRTALEAAVANQKRTMKTLVWNKEDVQDVYASLFRDETPYEFMEMPRALFDSFAIDSVLVDGKEVGVSTSRCYSYHFRDVISLCSIDLPFAEVGQQVEVLWGSPGRPQKAIHATVAPAPYKRDNRRVDVTALPATHVPA
ncbi:aminomethyltransferase [Pseudarthrobacter enclensis]|uniref:aminomethyltransferase family protein n=1 Tax=Pseudarthrobacter enclensis TaxID=993070 RepID=UPI0008158D21|nr:aminomethyltransferase family protein [Pseudarthrobacter enclensis]SCC29999.1 aminomethyltransferase [Pseudarthrobacter enclensis]